MCRFTLFGFYFVRKLFGDLEMLLYSCLGEIFDDDDDELIPGVFQSTNRSVFQLLNLFVLSECFRFVC